MIPFIAHWNVRISIDTCGVRYMLINLDTSGDDAAHFALSAYVT